MCRSFFYVCVFFILSFSCKPANQVDTIVHNGVVYTIDPQFSRQQAIAIADGRIVAVGKNDEILQKYQARETINAEGRPIYPGFIDAHSHFVTYGQSLFQVDLFGATSWVEVVERVQEFAAEHPTETCIKGRGWDQNKWPEKTYPTNKELTELFPDKPVLLIRVDGHAAIANQKLLDIAGVRPGQSVTGGEVETKDGKLTGILIDNAVDLVTAKIPESTINDFVKWLTVAQNNCFAVGLTTVTDCGLMYNDVQTIDGLQKEGKISMRFYIMLSDDSRNYKKYIEGGPYKTDKMYVKGFKVYADGALGSRGAY